MKSNLLNKIIVFDFDGTITTKDTFRLFLFYHSGIMKWTINMLSLTPHFLFYLLRIIDRNQIKAKVVMQFFKDTPKSKLNQDANNFAKEVIPKYIRKDAQKYLDSLKGGNEKIILCSASLSIYLKAWAASQGIVYVFGTELEQNDKNYTGKIEGENVWGQGKVNRINSELLKYEFIITEAYGDSRGDTEMLALAEKPFFKPFR
jgi:phosphatidylglycerophosphatase C